MDGRKRSLQNNNVKQCRFFLFFDRGGDVENYHCQAKQVLAISNQRGAVIKIMHYTSNRSLLQPPTQSRNL